MLAGLGVARADGLDPIALRQTVMDLQNADFAYLRAVVAAKGDVKTLEGPAKAMGRSAGLLPTLFPVGSEKGGNTKALAEIWSDSAGFQKASTALADAATKLATAAKAGDADEVAADVKLMGDQCGACHKSYRAR
ncbi:MAG TPA: cytochrome c [Rhodopila sp.]